MVRKKPPMRKKPKILKSKTGWVIVRPAFGFSSSETVVECRSFTHAVWVVTGSGASPPVVVSGDIEEPEVEE